MSAGSAYLLQIMWGVLKPKQQVAPWPTQVAADLAEVGARSLTQTTSSWRSAAQCAQLPLLHCVPCCCIQLEHSAAIDELSVPPDRIDLNTNDIALPMECNTALRHSSLVGDQEEMEIRDMERRGTREATPCILASTTSPLCCRMLREACASSCECIQLRVPSCECLYVMSARGSVGRRFE